MNRMHIRILAEAAEQIRQKAGTALLAAYDPTAENLGRLEKLAAELGGIAGRIEAVASQYVTEDEDKEED